MKALVADDVPMIRKLIEFHLREMGFEVSSAADGAEAVTLSSKAKFEIILLDLMMPVLSGLEVLKRIRSTGPNFDTPVIILTADGTHNNVETASHYAISSFLVKPVDQKLLRDKVTEALRQRPPKEE